MKIKFIMLAIIGLLTFQTANCQVNISTSRNSAVSALDTLINADTTSVVVIPVNGIKQSLTFQVNVAKISGTVAGSINIYGSSDGGTVYALIATDTLTNTTGTKAYAYSYAYSPHKKYKLEVITSGTVHAGVQRWIFYQ